MHSRLNSARVRYCLLTGGLIAVVFGVSVAQFVPTGRTAALLFAEKEAKGAVKDTLEFESFELVTVIAQRDESSSAGYDERVADESAETESAFNAAHLQRGPPLDQLRVE